MRILIFVFGLLVLTSTHSQKNNTDGFVFHEVNEKPSQNTIINITQDSLGMLWIGTRYGLNRYDGREFVTYYREDSDPNTLSGNRINDLILNENGTFWLATNNGVTLFDPAGNTFDRFMNQPNNPNSLGSNFTTSLTKDYKGNLWIGTEDGGVTMFNPNLNEYKRFTHNANDPYSLASNFILDILENENGHLWMGTWASGLDLFDPNTNRFIHYTTENSALTSNSIRVIRETSHGILLGTDNGLFRIDHLEAGRYTFEKVESKSADFSTVFSNATILSILEDKEGRLWIGSENKGLFCISNDLQEIDQYVNSSYDKLSIQSNSIWSLHQSPSGIIWIGSFNKGLLKVDPFHRKFNHISEDPMSASPLSFGVISAFEEQPGYGLWVGTDGGGLNLIDAATGTVKTFEHNPEDDRSLVGNAVLDLHLRDNGELWVASWEGGVSIKQPGADSFGRITQSSSGSSGLSGKDAYFLHEDDNNNIWISLFRTGIDIFSSDRRKIRTLIPGGEKSISNAKIRCIAEVMPGHFLLGTEGRGIDYIQVDDDYTITSKINYSHDPDDPSSLSNDDISTIYLAEEGEIWIGTFGGGINQFDLSSGTFSVINKTSGLPSNVVLTIKEDDMNNIWVGTGNGLCSISPNGAIRVFDKDDGLQDLEFTKGASYVSKDGELFFGGINGFNRFYPKEILRNDRIPPVVVTDFKLLGTDEIFSPLEKNDFLKNRSITLSHDQNDFAFDFSVLNYSQPEKNQYAYQLSSYDDEWIYTNNGSNISYTNVPPGSYTFKARGANNDGLWNEEGVEILVIIKNPWYLSGLAIISYALILVAFLFWARKLIINRERLKNELQLEHLELKKTQEISQLKSQFFANISHEFRTPLTLIIGPLKSLINDTYKGDHKNQFRIMARNADRLLRLINQILDLSKLESGSMGLQASEQDIVKFLKPIAYAFTSYADRQFITYKCHFPDNKLPVYFDGDKVEKIIINLLSNALKYTPEFGKVLFKVEEDNKYVHLIVEDTGVGISEKHIKYIFNRFYQVEDKHQKGTGIGLALTKELVDLHKGLINVESKEGEGTTFKVSLLKGQSHLTDDQITATETQYQYEHTELSDMELEVPAYNRDTETIKEDNNTEIDDLPVILVAEDNADMRLFISEYLVTNYKVIEAENGKEAIELALENIPDVIVSDIMMPEVNGYELCEKIKKDDRTSHIPVILLTAKASGESTEKGFEMGADYYVTKPFNPKLLELRIKNILKTRDKIHSQLSSSGEINLEPKNLNIGSKDQEFLNKIMACVEANFSNSMFGIDDLCKELGMSRTKLYRKLKGLIGQSANEFIRSFRLKRAAQLLRKQELTISEVTYQVGFNDLQYFRYCFKEQYGVNPSEYAQTAH